MDEDLRYPIGKFRKPETLTGDQRRDLIAQIAEAPERLRSAVANLNAAQLDTPYRPGGWTVRQLTHHVPDSHMNAYIRWKLALTEDEPTIKPYEEARWAELADARTAIEPSLDLLQTLHKRWIVLLESLTSTEWELKFKHPALGPMSLNQNLALYAWHGRHHVAHITSLQKRNNWYQPSATSRSR
jgi:DinB superfamily